MQGAIVLHFVGAIYFFTMVAYICSEYFLPSVECICEDLNLTQVNVEIGISVNTSKRMRNFVCMPVRTTKQKVHHNGFNIYGRA